MTIAQTPQAAQANASARLKQRDDAIRANGIKAGYAQRDAHWHKALGVKDVEEAREITQLRERPTRAEERKNCAAHWWQGATVGSALTAIVLGVGFAIYTLALTGGVLEQAVPMRAQQQITDQIAVERAAEYRRNAP